MVVCHHKSVMGTKFVYMSTFLLHVVYNYNAYNICKNSLQRAPCGVNGVVLLVFNL